MALKNDASCYQPINWTIFPYTCTHCLLTRLLNSHDLSPGLFAEKIHQTLWTSLHTALHFVTIRTYRPILFIYSVYWYWSHSDSHFIFLPASGPIVLIDSCAARYCDSELCLTVHYCALWPIVAVTLLFWWRLLFALPYCSLTVYKSGLLGTL